jgi:ferredoxin--NADP+ reductase
MTAGFAEGRVVGRKDWAPGLMTLRIEADIEVFEAGQFVNLGLYMSEGFERRSYSMASAPGEPLEFYLALVETGGFSPALFALKVGETVWVERKPQGFFTLRYVPDAKDLWLIATGTGLGPFIAMLRTPEPWQRFERIIVVHGVRHASHLSYVDELAALSRANADKLRHVAIVSREVVPHALYGRVTTTLEDGTLEQAAQAKLLPESSHVLLCGNPAMIEELTNGLKARGLRKHRVRQPGHISTEKYW